MNPGAAALPPGVGFLGLGGYEADPARLARAAAYFEGRGQPVTIAPAAAARQQRFAGDDATRLAALRQLLDAPDIGLVMALRGGYGLSRLLPALDFAAIAAAIRAGRKHFVGHSDFTAFHLALYATTGAPSLAGPMASYDFGGHGPDHALSAYTLEHFAALLDGTGHAVSFAADGPALAARGTLWGGNLAMLCSLLGTPWMPRVPGGILFLEDIGEQPYRIERMLLQLLHAGILDAQRAILLGDFANQQPTPYDAGFDLAAVVASLRARTRVPLVTGLPFGHIPDKLTLPVGGQAELRVGDGQARLAMSWSPRG